MLDVPPTPGRRGVIGIVVREGSLLVIRRSREVVAPRTYCFPGGGIEGNETEEEALRREFQEELAVDVRPLRHLWRNVTPWQVALSWWLVELLDDAPPEPNPAEVESVHWFTPDEIRCLPDSLPSNFEFLDAVAAGEIDLKW
ncbi:MAG: NUDIX domain-containing protein [Pirellulales bacterium]|nr:NUDIX domain-containing protein [Pirellulales bacterium]